MNRDQFLDALRIALNHLYDPDVLRRSPLAAALGVRGRQAPPGGHTEILKSPLQKNRPAPPPPPHTPPPPL
jgi:hypothetical protein